MFHKLVRTTALSVLAALALIISVGSISMPMGIAHAASHMTINGAIQYQAIDGFGFSGAFGPADQLRTLSSTSDRKQMLDLLFSTSTGAGFSLLRNLLPSDVTHTIEPSMLGSPTGIAHYVWDDNSWGQVWLAHQAQSYGVKQFYLDAWSAPGFMKTNGDEANGGTLCGVSGATCSSGDWRQAYANYLVQYIQDYKSDGIPITQIGFVNEPNLKTTYSSMVMSPAQTADFAKILGPTLRTSLFHPQIVCCEQEGWDQAGGTGGPGSTPTPGQGNQSLRSPSLQGPEATLGLHQLALPGGPSQTYAHAITSNPTANAYVDVISSHGYTGAPNSALSETGQKHIWQTEWSNLFDTWDPSWDDGSNASGFTWAQHLYTGLTAANLSAFFYWWGVGFDTKDNAVLIRYNQHTIEVSKRLWAFANYSRFVRPGAIRIGTTSSDSNVQLTAFKNTDGSISVVVLNTGRSDTPVTVSLQDTGITQGVASPYVTNTSNNTTAQVPLPIQGQTFSAMVGARSLVTYQIAASTVPTLTPTTSSTHSSASCQVHYAVLFQSADSFIATLKITNTGTIALHGWTLGFLFPRAGQSIQFGLDAYWLQQDTHVTAKSSGALLAGQATSIGFVGLWDGSNPSPTSFTLNGAPCSIL